MPLTVDAEDLKSGLLGLVVALVELLQEALRLQALRRMEAGSLTEEEVERLGEALLALDEALHKLKEDLGIAEAVQQVRDGLDSLARDLVANLAPPVGSIAQGGQEGL